MHDVTIFRKEQGYMLEAESPACAGWGEDETGIKKHQGKTNTTTRNKHLLVRQDIHLSCMLQHCCLTKGQESACILQGDVTN